MLKNRTILMMESLNSLIPVESLISTFAPVKAARTPRRRIPQKRRLVNESIRMVKYSTLFRFSLMGSSMRDFS